MLIIIHVLTFFCVCVSIQIKWAMPWLKGTLYILMMHYTTQDITKNGSIESFLAHSSGKHNVERSLACRKFEDSEKFWSVSARANCTG